MRRTEVRALGGPKVYKGAIRGSQDGNPGVELNVPPTPNAPDTEPNDAARRMPTAPGGAANQGTPTCPAASAPPAPTGVTPAPTPTTRGTLTSDPVATLKLKPRVIEVLSEIFDPEIPVSIYELGLIYDVIVDANHAVKVEMTLTAPNCPAAQTLPSEVKTYVGVIDGVTEVHVEIVWDPPWSMDRMSEAAKLHLGML